MVWPEAWRGEWDDGGRRDHHRRRTQFLSPDDIIGARMRARSTGERPPQINIFNDLNQDNWQRNDPDMSPSPLRGRGSHRFDELALAEELAELRLAARSHSRGRSAGSGHSRDASPFHWELQQARQQLRDRERDRDRQRVIEDYERRREREKKAQAAAVAQYKKEEEEKAQKEKEAYEAFLHKQREEELKKKEEEDKRKKEYRDMMWHDLAKFGFTENQIDAMMDPKVAHALPAGQSPNNPLAIRARNGVVTKVLRGDILDESLDFWGLQWELDRVDPGFLIIRHHLSEAEVEAIREHSARIRRRGGGVLLIEDNKRDKGDFVFVRRRGKTRSPGRRRSSPVRVGLRALLR